MVLPRPISSASITERRVYLQPNRDDTHRKCRRRAGGRGCSAIASRLATQQCACHARAGSDGQGPVCSPREEQPVQTL
eukprot:scaffold141924_cov23-Tisochrysis_lutea.AAC.7